MFPINKDKIALIACIVLVMGFFFAGITGILHYLIVKALLFSGFGLLLLFVVINANKDKTINENRPDD